MSPQSIRRSSMPALTTTTKPSIGLRKLIERPSYLIYLNVEPSLDNLCSPSMPEANRECATDLADVLHAAMEARRAGRRGAWSLTTEYKFLRAWYIGCALGLQPREEISIISARSNFWIAHNAETRCALQFLDRAQR